MNAKAPSNITTMFIGIMTLIAVMGIGRFSLTPQIPVMINDGYLTLSGAGIMASMNYIGYLIGALHVSRMQSRHAFYLKAGLLITVMATLLSGSTPNFALQCLFRLAAGIGGAWALIIVTTWTQLILLGNRAPRLSAAVFTGPGLGITLSGLLAWFMSAAHYHASRSWYIYGTVALLAALIIFRHLPKEVDSAQPHVNKTPVSSNLKRLVFIYALAGFGYILPATFLSQMARTTFPVGQISAFFWPLFGLSSAIGVILVIFFAAQFNTRNSLAGAMILQGIGVAAAVLIHNVASLLISTILTGLGFLVIMQLTMRLARELSSGSMARTVGLLTSGYATGQLIGPLISSLSIALFSSQEPALLLAAAGLVLGGVGVVTLLHSESARPAG
ncbi:MFS transporter [Serratia plymuthica]|uniref:YbfB/YjiJ family MFS transporter n=1 Tax=Serratia plymuthica TaxID=82996 RepID=UPI001F53D395|nr:YbfB/YjiJ family MFS transporter [Serratia plymuthica]UNK28841.1 MFS transporter [Serratia plymuthica]